MSVILAKTVPALRPVHAVAIVAVGWALVAIVRRARRHLKATNLRGPPRQNLLFGFQKVLNESKDSGALYEQWAQDYGSVYRLPTILGNSRVVLCDPKAIAHFYARESFTYVLTPLNKVFSDMLLGKGSLLGSEGEVHRRLRKSLTPAFSIAAIRKLTSVFYDSAYKTKAAWDLILESTPDGAIIEVQQWMNHISLDTIGIAGFSHDFGSLDGKHADVTEVFDSFSSAKPSPLFAVFLLLAPVLPWLVKLPNPRTQLVRKLNASMGAISNQLLARTRKEKEEGVTEIHEEKSIIGLLIKAENAGSELHLSQEEVLAQMKVLLLAGYETTSISLTWALLELSRDHAAQEKLREELMQLGGTDPTWDQLTSGLPYLDAVVHEVLRLHPPVTEMTRLAADDDVLPLSEPIQTASGQLVDRISMTKGTLISIPMRSVNRSVALWGSDAKDFKPERWIHEDGISEKAKEIQGHRHLLTFIDGPRTCLGKGFAVAEFKAVLSVLIRNFAFELRDGPETKVDTARGVLPRPKIEGEDGCMVPLRVRRLD
ncbi:cytochrome P450 [Leucogyrophana mollusca]|uniref:Cytochrome P450 n=1 Tax=Leucogyrophana mollusca TaxID=85980 RepID=A0ACB8BDE7_9AGAM|nr:cytochrome P450 [Leucogyrophana mollusca]